MRRPSIGSRRAKSSTLRATTKVPAQLALGKVYRPDSQKSWFEERTSPPEIIVFIKQIPNGEELECRLLGGPFYGIPLNGDDMVVVLPPGDVGDFEPMCLPLAMFRALPPGLVAGDAVIVARTGKKVRLGAAQGTQPLALAPNVESRLTALENHRHYCSTGTGSKPLTMSAAYTAAYPADTGSASISNPAHGQPFHVHDSPEPAAITDPLPGGGSGCAATLVEGI